MSRKSSFASAARSLCYPLLAAGLLAGAAGCHNRAAKAAATTHAAPPPPATVSDIDLKAYKPNEAGAVMIIMYHNFEANKPDTDLNRTPDSFRKDLQTLYDKGYRPINVDDLVDYKIDVPPGKTPVVLTFDDALPSQFKVVAGADGKAHIEPDCAVGILETFSQTHKDWPMRATFFVLPKEGRAGRDPFGQPETVSEKLGYLTSHGYEVANHTSTHANMRALSAEKIKWELATAVRDIKGICPAATMDTLALPYGNVPRKKNAELLVSGEDGGTSYSNKAVLRAAWRPVLSPITKDSKKYTDGGALAAWDPYAIERIKPDPKEATKPGTLEYWLKYFDEHPTLRFISDGNPRVAAVPADNKGMIDEERAAKSGVRVQVYGGTEGGGKLAGSSSLSVQ